MPDATSHLVPAVDRALRMLARLHGSEAGRRLSDLARDLDIPKSSAHQIARTLVHHGALQRDEDTGRYRLGNGLAAVGLDRAPLDLPELAGPYLEDLARAARMTALLGTYSDDGVILAAKIDSPDPIDISAPIGHRLDRRAGVFGKLADAARDVTELERALARPLPAFTRRSLTDPARYGRELNSVRERGYALDVEEYVDGVAAVGAAVRDASGALAGALCVIGLAASYKRAKLSDIGEHVRAAAEALSYDLGFRASRPTERTVVLPGGGT